MTLLKVCYYFLNHLLASLLNDKKNLNIGMLIHCFICFLLAKVSNGQTAVGAGEGCGGAGVRSLAYLAYRMTVELVPFRALPHMHMLYFIFLLILF